MRRCGSGKFSSEPHVSASRLGVALVSILRRQYTLYDIVQSLFLVKNLGNREVLVRQNAPPPADVIAIRPRVCFRCQPSSHQPVGLDRCKWFHLSLMEEATECGV